MGRRVNPLPPLRRKAVDQRQPVEAFAKPSRKIVDPALAAQTSALADLLHGHAEDQHLMHEHRAVGAAYFGQIPTGYPRRLASSRAARVT